LEYIPTMHINCDIECNCNASVQDINILNLYNIKSTIISDIDRLRKLGFTDNQYEPELNNE